MRRLLLVLLLLATAAPAQQGDVVVTGKRPDAARTARRLTRTVTPLVDGQVARLAAPVCVRSDGLPDPYGAAVVARVEAAARDAGVSVATAPCTPNLFVLFVEDGRAALLATQRRLGGLGVGSDARRRVLAEPGPVHVVQLTAIRSRDGDRPHGDPALLEVRSASNLNPATRQDITGTAVIVDRAATDGKTVRQLGDYAAMRALARTREADAGADTILTLFGEGAAPSGLTAFDRAYLAALYRGPATQAGTAKVSTMAGQVARAVEAR